MYYFIMSKKLILIRHAKSYWGKKGRLFFEGNDHDRPLNTRGKKNAKSMSQYFIRNQISVDYIFSSSAKRATETLSYFNKKDITKLGYNTCEELYTFQFYDLIKFIKKIDNKYDNIILIGHNPGIQDFCLEFILNQKNNILFNYLKTKFPTCAAAILLSNTKERDNIDKKGFNLKNFIIPKSISD